VENGTEGFCSVVRGVIQIYGEAEAAPPTVEELALRLGCGRRSLRRLFRQATGKTMRTYLAQLRATRALVSLALCPDISVDLVAAGLGYGDERAVRRLLVEQFGVGVKELRDCPPDVLAAIAFHRDWLELWWERGAEGSGSEISMEKDPQPEVDGVPDQPLDPGYRDVAGALRRGAVSG